MSSLASVWEELTDVQRANMAELTAGKRQGNIVMAMMSNQKDLQDSLTSALNSTNSALIENEKYMNSIEAKSAQFKNTVMGKWQEALDSDVIKNFVVAMTTLVEVLGNLNIVLAISTTAFLLWKGEAILGSISALASFITTESMATVSTTALTGAVGVLTKSFNALKLAVSTNPLGALAVVITTVVVGLKAYTNHVEKAREETEKLIQTIQSDVQNLKSQKEGLQELSSEYETLKNKEENLTATTEEKKRLLDIQKELVDNYGVSATGINLEGEAYADSIEAIKLRTLALEEEIAKEKEKLELNVLSADALNTKDIRKNVEEIDKLQKKLETAKKALPYLEKNDPYAAKLKKEQIAQMEKDIEESNSIIQKASKERKKYLEIDAQETIQTLESNGKKMSDSAKLVISEFAKSLALKPEDIQTQQQSLRDFINTVSNSDLDVLIEKYNKFISDINAGSNSEENKDGLAETSKEITNLINTLTKGDPALKEFAINFASLYPSTIDAKNAIDAISQYQTALTNLSKVYESSSSKIKDLNSILKELDDGGLSSDSVSKIIKDYPELIDYLDDEITLREQINNKISEEVERVREAYGQKMMLSEDFYKNTILANESYYSVLSDFYQGDLTKFRDLAKAKAGIEAELIKSLAKGWQMYYDTVSGMTSYDFTELQKAESIRQTTEGQAMLSGIRKIQEMNAAFNKLSQVDFTSTIGGKLSSAGDKGSGSKKDTYTSDQYAISLAKLDNQLKVLEYTKSKLSTTSEEYRNVLAKELDIYKQKQQLAHEEADRLRGLQAQVSQGTEEYDKYTKSIQDLQSTWLDLQSTIDDNKIAQFTSRVGESDVVIANTTDKLDKLQTQLSHLTQGTELYNKKSQEQINLTKENIKELESKQLLYQKEIALETENVARKNDLVESLKKVNTELFNTRIALIELQRQQEIIALEAERNAQLDASNKKIEAIDKEINSIKKLNETLEREKEIEDSILAISKAQLNVDKARDNLEKAKTKLANVQNEKNTRIFQNGRFEYIADPAAVKSALEEVENAKDSVKSANEALISAQESYNSTMQNLYLADLEAKKTAEQEKQKEINASFDEQKKMIDGYYDTLIAAIPVQGEEINTAMDEVLKILETTFGTRFKNISETVIDYIKDMKRELLSFAEETGTTLNLSNLNVTEKTNSYAIGGYIPKNEIAKLHANEYVLNSATVNALGGKSGVESMISSLRFPELTSPKVIQSTSNNSSSVDKSVKINNLNLPNVVDINGFVRNIKALA